MKYDDCVACQVCFYNRENESTMCKICDGDNMFIPISDAEAQEINLALQTENSKMRYYLDLNPVLSRVEV